MFSATVDDISVIYVTAHKSAVRIKSMNSVEGEIDYLYSKILESTNIWRLYMRGGQGKREGGDEGAGEGRRGEKEEGREEGEEGEGEGEEGREEGEGRKEERERYKGAGGGEA